MRDEEAGKEYERYNRRSRILILSLVLTCVPTSILCLYSGLKNPMKMEIINVGVYNNESMTCEEVRTSSDPICLPDARLLKARKDGYENAYLNVHVDGDDLSIVGRVVSR